MKHAKVTKSPHPKAKAKQTWGQLAATDLKKAEGSVERIYGAVQEKLGDAKDAIKAKLTRTHPR